MVACTESGRAASSPSAPRGDRLPVGDLGFHPVEDPADAGTHDVSFYCDDIEGTVRQLKSRGVTFTAPVADHGYGLVTYFEAPGGIKVQLYEPRYVKNTRRPAGTKKKTARRAGKAAPKKRTAAPKARKRRR